MSAQPNVAPDELPLGDSGQVVPPVSQVVTPPVDTTTPSPAAKPPRSKPSKKIEAAAKTIPETQSALPVAASPDATHPETDDQGWVSLLFTDDIAEELNGAVEWFKRVTDGAEISIPKIVDLALSKVDDLTESFLRGHATSRSHEELKRKAMATAFSVVLKGMATGEVKRKPEIYVRSLMKLTEAAKKMNAGLRNESHVRFAFDRLWREGGNLALWEWLQKRGDHIKQELEACSLTMVKIQKEEKAA